ncbi:MAG: hypothetical protein ACO1NZ_17015 [Adhaeribacter sp.]
MAISNQNDNQVIRYEYIIKKLYNTLDAYGEIFPELLIIREKLAQLPSGQHQGGDHSQELLTIENLLKGRAVKDYIVRHLYHNFKREVAAFQLGIPLDEEKEFFIDIPA